MVYISRGPRSHVFPKPYSMFPGSQVSMVLYPKTFFPQGLLFSGSKVPDSYYPMVQCSQNTDSQGPMFPEANVSSLVFSQGSGVKDSQV